METKFFTFFFLFKIISTHFELKIDSLQNKLPKDLKNQLRVYSEKIPIQAIDQKCKNNVQHPSKIEASACQKFT